MTIRYLSFDFDGCLFNKAYVQLPHDNFSKHKTDAVLVNNKAFLEKLKKQNSKFSAVYGFIGSTRQDYNTDLLNCGFSERFKGSCCSAMEIICDYLGITLDPFMLADAEGQLQSGTSFQRIMDEIKNNSWMDMKKNIHQHAACATMDEYKRTILFAQMQKAAADHPGEEIIFDFFDDRRDIVTTLKNYFTQYRHMIPKNVKLRLHSYAGEEDVLRASISGTGKPLSNYEFCLRTMHQNVHFMDAVAEALKEFAIPPEEKIKSLMEEVFENGLFIESAEETSNFFAKHPDAPFVAHPSRLKVDDLLLFSISYQTDKGIVSSRYGLDIKGKLYLVEPDARFEIEMNPRGLIATLALHVETAKFIVKYEENWQAAPLSPQPEPRKISKGEALYQELTESPYFVADTTQAKTALLENPDFPFVIRPSNTCKKEMFTFVVVYETTKGIISARFGLNKQGELFTLDDDEAYKLTHVTDNLISFLREKTQALKEIIEKAKHLEEVTFTPIQHPAATQENAVKTTGVSVSDKGFFSNKTTIQPMEERTSGYGRQP